MEKQRPLYKYFMSKGNNSMSLRLIMGGRHWWQEYSKPELDKVNFMWSQLLRKPMRT